MPKIVFVFFVFATVVQLGFWLLVYSRVAFFSKKRVEKKGNDVVLPPVSVLICARNEAQNLQKNLPTVLSQNYPDFEIIVVNDASTDETASILADFESKNPHFRVLSIFEKTTAGKKTALASAIRAAKNDCLVLTDADCWPATPFWLKNMARPLAEGKKIVLGYGPYQKERGFLNRWIRFEAAWTALQYFSFALAGWPYMGVGRNLAYRKSLFEKMGGFESHAELASGDDDLFVSAAATSKNTAICLTPEAFVFSEGKKSWAEYARQKRRHFTTGNRYRWFQKYALGSAALSHSLHFFLACWLGLTTPSMVFVSMCIGLRIMVVWLIWSFALRRFRETGLRAAAPFFDFCLILLHVVFSPVIFFRYNKPNSWI